MASTEKILAMEVLIDIRINPLILKRIKKDMNEVSIAVYSRKFDLFHKTMKYCFLLSFDSLFHFSA